MKNQILSKLTDQDDKAACQYTEQIIQESLTSNVWYPCFEDFASLLSHPKSLVRNRALKLLAANIRWDSENRFDTILPEYLSHITDERPITARQCIQALSQIGSDRPQYIPRILSSLQNADLSRYKDSMRPLLEKDIAQTIRVLTPCCYSEEKDI